GLVVADVLGAGGAERRPEVGHDPRDAAPTGDRDPVPAAFSVMRALVPPPPPDPRAAPPAGDRDPVPGAFSVMRELVPARPEDVRGRIRVRELRLLHQQDV